MSIDLGDTIRLSTRNLSPAGDLVTATNMTLTITRPDDTTVVINPVAATGTGVYSYDYPTTQAGRHSARWVATGTGAGAYAEVFDVRPADLPYLVSLRDVKLTLNMSLTDTTYDEELRVYIESATSAAEDHRDEVLAKRTFTHEQHFRYAADSFVLPKRPVVSLTSIENVETGSLSGLGGYHLDGSTGKVWSTTGGYFTGLLKFTYVAGYTVVPSAYSLAVRLIIQHLWETQRGPQGASRFAGGMDDAALMRFRSMNIFVPPRAQELLGDRMPMV
jgi:hypothetical protein